MKVLLSFFALYVLQYCVHGDTSESDSRQWSYYPQSQSQVSQVATSRDSYVKAAEHSTSIKGGDSSSLGVQDSYQHYYPTGDSSAYYYQIHPNTKAKYYGYGNGNGLASKQFLTGNIPEAIENGLDGNFFEKPDEAVAKTDPVSIAGLASLVVSSLSGLSWVGIAALALILGPILVPCVLAPLIMLGIIIYFIPVVRLDLPADNTGRSLVAKKTINALKHLEGTARFVQHIAVDEECIERISCEIARMARGNMFENWINRKLESYKNKWVTRVSRSFKAAINGSDCRIYSCNPGAQLKKVAHVLGKRT